MGKAIAVIFFILLVIGFGMLVLNVGDSQGFVKNLFNWDNPSNETNDENPEGVVYTDLYLEVYDDLKNQRTGANFELMDMEINTIVMSGESRDDASEKFDKAIVGHEYCLFSYDNNYYLDKQCEYAPPKKHDTEMITTRSVHKGEVNLSLANKSYDEDDLRIVYVSINLKQLLNDSGFNHPLYCVAWDRVMDVYLNDMQDFEEYDIPDNFFWNVDKCFRKDEGYYLEDEETIDFTIYAVGSGWEVTFYVSDLDTVSRTKQDYKEFKQELVVS